MVYSCNQFLLSVPSDYDTAINLPKFRSEIAWFQTKELRHRLQSTTRTQPFKRYFGKLISQVYCLLVSGVAIVMYSFQVTKLVPLHQRQSYKINFAIFMILSSFFRLKKSWRFLLQIYQNITVPVDGGRVTVLYFQALPVISYHVVSGRH